MRWESASSGTGSTPGRTSDGIRTHRPGAGQETKPEREFARRLGRLHPHRVIRIGDLQRRLLGLRPATESTLRRADTVPAPSSQHPCERSSPKPNSVRPASSIRSESSVALTLEGAVAGTPAYMPPEQAEGDLAKIDHRSDIYSMGAILYEILTRERPIEGKTVTEGLLKVADGKVVPPEQRAPSRPIPRELSAVAMKAMAKNRRKRYQSVKELAEDIRLFLEGRSVSAKEDSFARAFVKLVRRNKGVSVAVAAAALVLAVFTWGLWST